MATRMTEQEARTFDRYSLANAARAMSQLQASGACKGQCQAYDDMFTYNRWAAQGYQVRKGEHGARLGIIITTWEDDKGEVVAHSRPWSAYVFCRCQVDKKGTGHAA